MNKEFSAIILAGGLSRRMGKDKRSLSLHGKTLFNYSKELATHFSDEILISANDDLPLFAGFPRIPDTEKGAGPLLAIASTLPHASHPDSLVLTCDMPFLSVEIIERLINQHIPGKISLYLIDQILQPFPAIIPGSCLQQLENCIAKNIRSMKKALEELPVNLIVTKSSSNELSFLNINRQDEFKKAEKILKNLDDLQHKM